VLRGNSSATYFGLRTSTSGGMGVAEDVDVTEPDETTSLLRPALRQPAPTIAIDSSAVSRPQSVATLCEEPSLPLEPPCPDRPSSSIENRPLLSFESRPPSSYSISFPTSRGDYHSSDVHNHFSSIVKALEWGRAVNDSVKKFLQASFPWSEILSF
jgi:hypothetical protein